MDGLSTLFAALARKLCILPATQIDQPQLLSVLWKWRRGDEMKKRYALLLLLSMIGTGLFCYNYWSYASGRCNSESLWAISFPAGVLIGINLLALTTLFFVLRRQRRGIDPLQCGCGSRLHPDWHFCPDCGQVRTEDIDGLSMNKL